MKITSQWLRYSTLPNVKTLLTQKSHANNFALVFFFNENLTWLLLSFSFQPQTGFHFPLKAIAHNNVLNVCYKFAQIRHTQANMTAKQQSIDNDYIIRVHTFEWEPAMILMSVIMELKR